MKKIKYSIIPFMRSVSISNFQKAPSGRGWGCSGFTLVELIVVITILAILATIGFVSFSGYLAGTRDTNRIAQLKSMADALELYSTKKDLPIPDDKVDIKVDDEIIAYQGDIGKNVLETIEYTESGLDPKYKEYFSYYLIKNKKYFQLMAFLEEENKDTKAEAYLRPVSSVKKLSLETGLKYLNATDYSDKYPHTQGKKLGILTDTENNPIQKIETITSSGYLEMSGSTDKYIANISNGVNLELEADKLKYTLITNSDKKYKAPSGCPDGFISVPGNAQFNQRGFCVAQYEMSYDETGASDVTGGTDWNTRKYNSSKTPVSMKNRLPVTEIKQGEAIEQCKKIGTHLITNNEWMTIARNIELQKENYISGGPGDGVLKNGVSNDTSKGCAGKQDGSKWAGPTGSDCNGTDRNKLVLSNGKTIYDFAGNVWEHVNKANTLDGGGYNNGQTSVAGSSNGTNWDDDGIYNLADMDKYGSLYHLGKDNGMGNVYYANGVANNIFLRGAYANGGSGAGVFTLYLNRTSGTRNRVVGFRCAK